MNVTFLILATNHGNMRIYYSLFICLFSFFLQAQDGFQINREYSPVELKEDLGNLVESLESYHPGLYEFVSKSDFDAIIAKLKSDLSDGMTQDEFHIVIRRLIAQIACGHTVAYPSIEWYAYQNKNPKSLPLYVYVLNDALYVRYYQKDSLNMPSGQEIVSINDRQASDILHEMRSIQQRDGYTNSFVDASIKRYFSLYYLFLYGTSETYTVRLRDNDGKESTVSLEGGRKTPLPTLSKSPDYQGNGMDLYFDKEYENLAILDINNFSSKGYKKNYKYIFSELEKKNIDHLVIDLRNNGGGYFSNGNYLLRYLLTDKFYFKFSRSKDRPLKNKNIKMGISSKMTKALFNIMPDYDKSDPQRNYAIKNKPVKKNHFDGKVYVITNGGSFSMSGAITTRLKHDRNAMIIGSESGGGENGSYAVLKQRLTLPNTKIRVVIPYYFLDHDVTPAEKGRGVIPDIIVEYSINEIISGRDKELEVVRNKMK